MLKDKHRIGEQIRRSGRRLQRFEGRLLWLRAIPVMLAILLVLLLLDLALQLSPSWRLGLLLGYLSMLTGTFVYALWLGFGKQADPRRTARHLEERCPELGSSLMNFLDLEATVQDSSKPELTRKMASHAQAEHAETASHVQLTKLVVNTKLKSGAQALGISLLVLTSLCFAFWPFFRAHLARLFDPYGAHPPYSLTTLVMLEPISGAKPIIFGESLRIHVEAKGHAPDQIELSYWPTERPDEVFRTAMLPRGKKEFVQGIEELEEPITIQAQTLNGRSRTEPVSVDVYLNPKIEAVELEIHPPAYTRLPVSKRAYGFNELRVLRTSKILLRTSSNRPLHSGEIRMDRPLEVEAHSLVPMQPTDETTVLGEFVADQSTGFSITVTDQDGLVSERSQRGAIMVAEDNAPSVSITSPKSSTLLALDAALTIRAEAFDDYGLKELRLHRAINGVFTAPVIISASEQSPRLDMEWTLDFATIGVQQEDVVSIYAEAIDIAPEPQVTRSEMIRITAISVEDYNSLLRQEADMARVAKKYEALRERFEELMEEQASLLEEARALHEKLEQTTDEAERQRIMEELEKLQLAQAEINEALKELANDMEQTVRDEPLYDVESSFKQQLTDAAGNIRKAANTNDQRIQSILQQMKSPGNSPQQEAALAEALAQAMQEQRDQLMGQESTMQEIEESAEEMGNFHEMLKNFNRYTALTNEQRSLANAAAAYNRIERLSREDELALRDLAHDQKMIRDELELLIEKFRRDAEAGAEAFPQAAASSLDFAAAIQASRSPLLSKRSTDAMLDGEGMQSAELAAATAEAMESLLSQCNGGMGEMSSELDRRLSATRPGSNPAGNTYEQMLENMRMRYGMGQAQGFGTGGQGGSTPGGGFSTPGSEAPALAGNESLAGVGSSSQDEARTGGSGSGTGDSSQVIDSTGEEGSLSELEEQRRNSASVRGESLFIEHDDIIDAYFEKITE
ncbi:MAG: hypothetical protein ACPGSB_00990 [Opitutales bacterium]